MRAGSPYVHGLLAALALACVAREGSSQATPRPPRIAPALRVDGFVARGRAVHAGIGLGVRLGTYAHLDVTGAAGMGNAPGADADARTSGRVEVLGRFALDPFEQFRRGPYAGAGLAVRLDEGARRRVHLTAVVGVEGRPASRWRPALELGFGGGVRVGAVFRRSGRR